MSPLKVVSQQFGLLGTDLTGRQGPQELRVAFVDVCTLILWQSPVSGRADEDVTEAEAIMTAWQARRAEKLLLDKGPQVLVQRGVDFWRHKRCYRSSSESLAES